ncbi:hypothetical protein [Leptospira santarosai]|uniref:Uncharacterized protein n=1 Tax=Leptospira santarosai TaxID=28183 RepID=A0AB73M3Z2_9LEPT|nr:hypothetical protein [Leptospira santarosai]ONF92629.1 hypothetical protein BWD14_11935 [Leptospira santarosai]
MRKLEKWKLIVFTVLVVFFLDPLHAKDPKEAEIRSYAEKYLDEFLIKQPLCLNPRSEEYKSFNRRYYAKLAVYFPGGAAKYYVIDTYRIGTIKKEQKGYWLEILFNITGYLEKGKIVKLNNTTQTRHLRIILENHELKISREYTGFFFLEKCALSLLPKFT